MALFYISEVPIHLHEPPVSRSNGKSPNIEVAVSELRYRHQFHEHEPPPAAPMDSWNPESRLVNIKREDPGAKLTPVELSWKVLYLYASSSLIESRLLCSSLCCIGTGLLPPRLKEFFGKQIASRMDTITTEVATVNMTRFAPCGRCVSAMRSACS